MSIRITHQEFSIIQALVQKAYGEREVQLNAKPGDKHNNLVADATWRDLKELNGKLMEVGGLKRQIQIDF